MDSIFPSMYDCYIPLENEQEVLNSLRNSIFNKYKNIYNILLDEIEIEWVNVAESNIDEKTKRKYFNLLGNSHYESKILGMWLDYFRLAKDVNNMDMANLKFAEGYVSIKDRLNEIDFRVEKESIDFKLTNRLLIERPESSFDHHNVIYSRDSKIEKIISDTGNMNKKVKQSYIDDDRKKYYLYLLEFRKYNAYVLDNWLDRRKGVNELNLADYLDKKFDNEYEESSNILDDIYCGFKDENTPIENKVNKYLEEERKKYAQEKKNRLKNYWQERDNEKENLQSTEEKKTIPLKKEKLVEDLKNSIKKIPASEEIAQDNIKTFVKSDILEIARQNAYNMLEYKYLEKLSDMRNFSKRITRQTFTKLYKNDEYLKIIVDDANNLIKKFEQEVNVMLREDIESAKSIEETKAICVKYLKIISTYGRSLEKLVEEYNELLRVRNYDRQKALKEQEREKLLKEQDAQKEKLVEQGGGN